MCLACCADSFTIMITKRLKVFHRCLPVMIYHPPRFPLYGRSVKEARRRGHSDIAARKNCFLSGAVRDGAAVEEQTMSVSKRSPFRLFHPGSSFKTPELAMLRGQRHQKETRQPTPQPEPSDLKGRSLEIQKGTDSTWSPLAQHGKNVATGPEFSSKVNRHDLFDTNMAKCGTSYTSFSCRYIYYFAVAPEV